MRNLFRVVIIVVVFALGVYVGRLPIVDLVLGKSPAPAQPVSSTQAGTNAEGSAATPAIPEVEKPITVSATQLSAGQRQLLTTLGINADAITITPAMAACAEGKLGTARLAEIQAGATPSFTEGASLLACYH